MLNGQSIYESHVMVVGCGALGNEVLKNLVLMGIQHLVIVDFDNVEQGNLTRSILYRKCDVGERKVDVAKKTLLDINPKLDVKTIYGDVAYDVGLGLVRRMDVIIGCVDNRWARYCIQRLCHRAGKTWIDGGILDLTGSVKVFKPGVACYACSLGSEALKDMQRRISCTGVIRRREAAGHATTTPVIASIIGAVQVQEAIRLLNDNQMTNDRCKMSGTNRMFSYDGETMKVMTPVLEAWDEDCALHGEWDMAEGQWLMVDDQNIDMPISYHLSHDTMRLLLNEPFVDYVVSRKTDERVEVMLPAHKVEDFFTETPWLRDRMMSDFYQHEYREIDGNFPYPNLTLRELGVPEDEILRVRINDNNLNKT